MKKAVHLSLILFFIAPATEAQITKGKILLGGTLAYYQRTENYSDNSFAPAKQGYVIISPAIGRVIKENLVFGVEASYSAVHVRYENPAGKTENKTKNYGGALFLRQYVPLLKNFYFYGQAATGISNSKGSQTYNGKPYIKTTGVGATVSLVPGLTYAVTKRLFAEAGLNNFALLSYGRLKSETTDVNSGIVSSAKASDFNFSTNLGSNGGFSIGFRFLL